MNVLKSYFLINVLKMTVAATSVTYNQICNQLISQPVIMNSKLEFEGNTYIIIKVKLLIYFHTDFLYHSPYFRSLYTYTFIYGVSCLHMLCNQLCVHTLPHIYSALWLATLSTPFLALYVMLSAVHTPHRMSVCCHGDGSVRACVLRSLSTEERKCDLMPCPDSALTWLQRCSVQRSQLSVSVWSHTMPAWTQVPYWI